MWAAIRLQKVRCACCRSPYGSAQIRLPAAELAPDFAVHRGRTHLITSKNCPTALPSTEYTLKAVNAFVYDVVEVGQLHGLAHGRSGICMTHM